VISTENERDEDLGSGKIPQMPPGFVVIVDIEAEDPMDWPALVVVDVTGLDGVYEPTDPKPEYVFINEDNVAVVTLQENNAVVLINVGTGMVVDSFSMGTTDLENVDVERDNMILQTEDLDDVLREPDGMVSEHDTIAALSWLS
jgi:hypothetical protein